MIEKSHTVDMSNKELTRENRKSGVKVTTEKTREKKGTLNLSVTPW